MTIKRTIVRPKDIVSLVITCAKCHTEVRISLSGETVPREHCPACTATWWDASPGVQQKIALDTLYQLRQLQAFHHKDRKEEIAIHLELADSPAD